MGYLDVFAQGPARTYSLEASLELELRIDHPAALNPTQRRTCAFPTLPDFAVT
jgi:hypothetical protein